MVKYIPDVNSWQLLFVRCVSQLVTMVPIMVLGKHHILGTPDWATRWRLAAQGILGGLLLLGIFEAVARQSEKLVREGNTQEWANTVWAFAKIGVPLEGPVPGLFEAVAGKSGKLAREGNTQGLANTVWAYAKIGQ